MFTNLLLQRIQKNGNSLIQEKMKSLFKKPFIFSLKPLDVFKIPLEIRHKKKSVNIKCLHSLAEREGFEPPVPRSTTVFKTAAIDHSAISPKLFLRSASFQKRCKGTTYFWICKHILIFFQKKDSQNEKYIIMYE